MKLTHLATRKLYALMTPLLLLGCGGTNSGVENAKGETPVKFVICSQDERQCLVAARFTNLDGCERHKHWAEMLCDSKSEPGKMVCTSNKEASIAVSYCTL